ncbi:mitochondrial pyruvate carrier [Phycomyces nitens]|nr:mitochondrial pyruvate carrier [Phycomyces nitens]
MAASSASSAVAQTAIQRFINSPAGPKTIHFWAPLTKWGLVIATLGDLERPVEKLSLKQNASLVVTGLLWSRYAMVIIPKNWSLFAVNAFVAGTAMVQTSRIVMYQQSDAYKQEQAKQVASA